ncbi:MAG: hypothetical protein JO302_03145 [Candidatus Eremiobacteraeota bacterium]|nr:hypothetical protein [Candidatus Eremiobacteraeota bacterium]
MNNIPPRLQWNANNGYCGEVAFISAGLYYGQYISQYDARAIASNNGLQNKASSQLLIGVNDTYAATQMHLTYAEWNTGSETNTNQFLAWVTGQVVAGYPVAIGVYTNEYLFYGKTNPNAGDPDYDHIVPVTQVGSNHLLTNPATYYSDDTITFNDNGLWAPGGQPQYVFSYPFGTFEATRQQANAKSGNIYSVSSDGSNYGIAITGVIDQNHETLPVKVATNLNYEKPSIKNGSNTRPSPEALTLTVTVSGLQPGSTYKLYRYNAMSNVPNSAFNANASQAYEKWTISATSNTYTMTENIQSSDEAIYRAVAASAP